MEENKYESEKKGNKGVGREGDGKTDREGKG